ncbi:unnamed protein product [Diamesa hyperborea]
MASRVKTRESANGEIIAYSETAIRNNISNVEYVKTSLSSLSGCTAGILGLTGVLGFVFYLIAVLSFFTLLVVKSGKDWQKYFIDRRSLLTNGFMGGLCTYTLFWTFLYGMVHVY